MHKKRRVSTHLSITSNILQVMFWQIAIATIFTVSFNSNKLRRIRDSQVVHMQGNSQQSSFKQHFKTYLLCFLLSAGLFLVFNLDENNDGLILCTTVFKARALFDKSFLKSAQNLKVNTVLVKLDKNLHFFTSI